MLHNLRQVVNIDIYQLILHLNPMILLLVSDSVCVLQNVTHWRTRQFIRRRRNLVHSHTHLTLIKADHMTCHIRAHGPCASVYFRVIKSKL